MSKLIYYHDSTNIAVYQAVLLEKSIFMHDIQCFAVCFGKHLQITGPVWLCRRLHRFCELCMITKTTGY